MSDIHNRGASPFEGELPALPLGLTVRQHVENYLNRLMHLIKQGLVTAPLKTVHRDLEGMLEFTAREDRLSQGDSSDGGYHISVAAVPGHRVVISFVRADVTIAAPIFNREDALSLAKAMTDGVEMDIG